MLVGDFRLFDFPILRLALERSPLRFVIVVEGTGGNMPPHCVTAAAIWSICRWAELLLMLMKDKTQRAVRNIKFNAI